MADEKGLTVDPDLDSFRRQARQWLEANLQPRPPDEPFLMRGGESHDESYFASQRALQRRIHEAGYAGINWPREYGGRGLSDAHARVFAEESMHFRMPDLGHAGGTTYGPCGQTLIRHGSPDFLSRHIPRILAGEELFVQLFSEPGAGSDMAGITTRAELDGDRWLLTGSKIWTSGAHQADYGMCLARTNWDVPKHRGLTWFAVALSSPGVTIQPIREISGEAEFCQEFLDHVEVPTDEVIGEVDQGWTVAQTMLLFERSAGREDPRFEAPPEQGMDPALISFALRSGRSKDPVVRQSVARVQTTDWARTQLGKRISGLTRSGMRPAAGVASYWKLSAGIYNPERARLLMEIGQGSSVAWAPDDQEAQGAAAEYLNSRVWSIAGGSNEMQRNSIGERVLDLPREPSYDKDRPFNEVLKSARQWVRRS